MDYNPDGGCCVPETIFGEPHESESIYAVFSGGSVCHLRPTSLSAIVTCRARSAGAHPRCGEIKRSDMLGDGSDTVRASGAKNHCERSGRFAPCREPSPACPRNP